MRKKLVYVQHLQAWDEAQRKAQEGETPTDDIDPGDIANGGMDQMPSGIGGGSSPSGGQHHTGKDIHPKLRQYPGLVNVQNPGEDMGWERRDEIMHGPDNEETVSQSDPDVVVDTQPDRIDQAGEE